MCRGDKRAVGGREPGEKRRGEHRIGQWVMGTSVLWKQGWEIDDDGRIAGADEGTLAEHFDGGTGITSPCLSGTLGASNDLLYTARDVV